MMYFDLFELYMIGGEALYAYLCFLFHIVPHWLLIYIYEVIHDICLVVYDYVKSRIYFVLFVFSIDSFMCLLSVTGIYRLI